MPRINLLPWREAERKKRQQDFMIALAGAVVAASGVIALTWLAFVSMIDDQTRRNQRLETEIAELEKSITEIDSLERQKERLLARMETIEQLQRSRPEVVHLFDEITKQIALSQIDPIALLELRQTGECQIELPEWVFDADYPGHYMRRIKSVGLSLPCVVGPYSGVHCTLTLLSSKVRLDSHPEPYEEQENDPRFSRTFGAIQSIATSRGQGDSGLFELNFRDERYLPGEGAGAISSWHLEMSPDHNALDFDTLADVIFHLGYTAREGGKRLRMAAKKAFQDRIANDEWMPLMRLFSSRHEFPTEWHRFLRPGASTGDQALKISLAKDRFPLLYQTKNLVIRSIDLFFRVNPEFADSYDESTVKVTMEPGAGVSGDPMSLAKWNGLLHASKENVDWDVPAPSADDQWTLIAWLDAGSGEHSRLDPQAIEDICVICHYTYA